MNVDPNEVGNDDRRRAAALVLHYANDDTDGFNAIVTEANELGRGTHLIVALLAIYDSLIPELRTKLGQQLLSGHIVQLAGSSE